MIMKNQRKLRGAIDMGTTKVAALIAEETARATARHRRGPRRRRTACARAW